MANRYPLIANSSSNQIQELAAVDNLDLTGNNIVGVVDVTASGNVSVGGTLTYEDVTNVDSVGIITARQGVLFGVAGVGGTVTADGHASFSGIVTARYGNCTETVSVGTTSRFTDSTVCLELDCGKGTIFTHDCDNGVVGIVSIKNFRVDAATFTTSTVIFTQKAVGLANTTFDIGIGTEMTLAPIGVAGFSTSAMVGAALTVVLSDVNGDIDIVSFGVKYNGGGTGSIGNYKVFASESVQYRYGVVGF